MMPIETTPTLQICKENTVEHLNIVIADLTLMRDILAKNRVTPFIARTVYETYRHSVPAYEALHNLSSGLIIETSETSSPTRTGL